MLKKIEKLAFVVWRFPVVSQTFILNQIHFFKKQFPEVDFSLFSIKHPTDPLIHEKSALEQNTAHYLPGFFSPKLTFTVMKYISVHPVQTILLYIKLLKQMPVTVSLQICVYYFFQSWYCFIMGIYFASELNKNKIEHLHAHFADSSGFITCVSSILTGVPYSISFYGSDIYLNKNNKNFVFLIQNSKFSTVISEHMKTYISGIEPKIENKIHVVYDGLDLGMFEVDKDAIPSRFTIVSVARLIKGKGIHDLIDACSGLLKEFDYKCVIIGDGPERENLAQQIKSYDLEDRIQLLGYLSQKEIIKYLQQASVFVLPSYSEGIPNTLKEAMMLQIPVISTKIKGIPELVKNDSGILLEPGDVQKLREAIITIFNKTPEQRKQMGQEGQRIVKQFFDINQQVKILYEKFSEKG